MYNYRFNCFTFFVISQTLPLWIPNRLVQVCNLLPLQKYLDLLTKFSDGLEWLSKIDGLLTDSLSAICADGFPTNISISEIMSLMLFFEQPTYNKELFPNN